MLETHPTSATTVGALHHNHDELSHDIPFNYRYFLKLAAAVGGRVLDYGCGRGEIVRMGRQHGLDLWGADTYSGHYMPSLDAVAAETRVHIRQIHQSHADFPDAHFDLVLSNQVLEHVTEPEIVIDDMNRLLRPGGTLIAAFPVISTWYEGHVGLYFAHRLPPGSVRHAMFVLAHRLGCGLYRGTPNSQAWAANSERTLDDLCFYHPRARILNALRTIGAINDISVDYMRTRLGNRVRSVPDAFLRFVYHKRAGEIFKVVKAV